MKRTVCLSTAAVVMLILASVLATRQGLASVLATRQGLASGPVSNHPTIPAPIIINEDDNGTAIDARVEQSITIMLQEPWGGAYGWELREIRGDAVKYIGRTPHTPGRQSVSSQASGKTETSCFRLTAVKEGQATVSLVCTPPPGLMVPTRLFEVSFNVYP